MTFTTNTDRPMRPTAYVGVAIRATNQTPQRMHVGILYLSTRNEVKFAHLAFHKDLRNDSLPLEDEYFWEDCRWLMQDGMDSVAQLIADFIEACVQTNEIPYGPNPPVDAFDAFGRYQPKNPREGLTCATFVSEIFSSVGFPVVELNTWRSRDEDNSWWHDIESLLKRSAPDRASELAGVQLSFRLRPDEVAVSATNVETPLQFDDAVRLSLDLQGILFPSSQKTDAFPTAISESNAIDANF